MVILAAVSTFGACQALAPRRVDEVRNDLVEQARRDPDHDEVILRWPATIVDASGTELGAAALETLIYSVAGQAGLSAFCDRTRGLPAHALRFYRSEAVLLRLPHPHGDIEIVRPELDRVLTPAGIPWHFDVSGSTVYVSVPGSRLEVARDLAKNDAVLRDHVEAR